jgi:hypothetical protein
MNLRASAIILAAAVAAAPAYAKTVPQLVTATYSGFVAPGSIDVLGDFVPAGGSLAGMPFTATFAVNERAADFSPYAAAGAAGAVSTGHGSLEIGNSGINVDGISINIATGNTPANSTNPNMYYYDSAFGWAYELSPSKYIEYHVEADLELPGKLPGNPDYHSYLLNGFVWSAPPGQGAFRFDSPFSSESFGLLVDSLTVTSVRAPKPSSTFSVSFQTLAQAAQPLAVPEPATWTMTLLGLGAIGALVRRRREIMNPPARA